MTTMNSYSLELFEELWCKYYRKIYSYFRRQFDEDTAEDLCQQTYLNAWRYISTYTNSNIRQDKAWLFAVARNVKNDHLRYVQIHSMNFKYQNLYETDATAEFNIDDSLAIQKAISKLNEEEKQLISMAEHLTSKEIGSVLGLSASAVRNRIQKAKQKLKQLLEENEINI